MYNKRKRLIWLFLVKRFAPSIAQDANCYCCFLVHLRWGGESTKTHQHSLLDQDSHKDQINEQPYSYLWDDACPPIILFWSKSLDLRPFTTKPSCFRGIYTIAPFKSKWMLSLEEREVWSWVVCSHSIAFNLIKRTLWQRKDAKGIVALGSPHSKENPAGGP